MAVICQRKLSQFEVTNLMTAEVFKSCLYWLNLEINFASFLASSTYLYNLIVTSNTWKVLQKQVLVYLLLFRRFFSLFKCCVGYACLEYKDFSNNFWTELVITLILLFNQLFIYFLDVSLLRIKHVLQYVDPRLIQLASYEHGPLF